METDCLDLFLIHWPDTSRPLAEPMRALDDLVQAGKIRYAGVSNFSAEQVDECLQTTPLVTDQVGFSLFDRRPGATLFPYLRAQGIGAMAYGPLAHGLLTGAFTPQTTFADQDWRAKGTTFGLTIFKGDNFKRNLMVVERLKDLAADESHSIVDLAIAWVLRQEAVTVALVGARTPAEIEQNVRAANWPLGPHVLSAVDLVMADAAVTTPE